MGEIICIIDNKLLTSNKKYFKEKNILFNANFPDETVFTIKFNDGEKTAGGYFALTIDEIKLVQNKLLEIVEKKEGEYPENIIHIGEMNEVEINGIAITKGYIC